MYRIDKKPTKKQALVWAASFVLTICCMAPGCLWAGENDDGFDSKRWEKDIQAFEAEDREKAPIQEGILFVGSSSIRMWKVEKSFPDLPVMNRGFGGSHMEDVVFYADRMVIPYQPKIIVLYEGDNDISGKKTPQRVFSDYKEFVRVVHEALPQTRIIYIPIKPSISRWNLVEPMREANRMIQEYIQTKDWLDYVEIEPLMLGEDGKPIPSLFLEDGLHLSDKGYELWTQALRPFLTW